MTTSKLSAQVSKWEIAGIPAATLLAVLYEMESLPEVIKADLPRLMLILYVVVALVRLFMQRKGKADVMTGIRATRVDVSVPDEK